MKNLTNAAFILDQATIGLMVLDPATSTYIYISEKAAELTSIPEGVSLDTIMSSRKVTNLEDQIINIEDLPALRVMKTKKTINSINAYIFDGKKVWINTIAFPYIQENGRFLVVETINDITDLINAQKRLTYIESVQQELIQNVGHELRTPLTIILTTIELLALGYISEPEKAYETIQERGRKMSQMINAILSLVVEPYWEKFSLADTVLKQVLDNTLNANRAGVSLEYDYKNHISISGDYNKVSIMIGELIDNAIKFGSTQVILSCYKREDGKSVVSVKDNGIGIAHDNHQKIFQNYIQLSSGTTRRYSGIGLGLAVVKHIADLHGATIELESEIGKGSEFRIVFVG